MQRLQMLAGRAGQGCSKKFTRTSRCAVQEPPSPHGKSLQGEFSPSAAVSADCRRNEEEWKVASGDSIQQLALTRCGLAVALLILRLGDRKLSCHI